MTTIRAKRCSHSAPYWLIFVGSMALAQELPGTDSEQGPVMTPPGAPPSENSAASADDSKSFALGEVYEQNQNGLVAITIEEYDRLSLPVLRANYARVGDVADNLSFELSKFVPPDGFSYDGVTIDERLDDGRHARAQRVYIKANGHVLLLSELDYVSAGLEMIQVPEAVNASVDGKNATATVRMAPNGEKIAMLTWLADKKLITLLETGPEMKKRTTASLIAVGTLVGR